MGFTCRSILTGHTGSVHALQLDSWRVRLYFLLYKNVVCDACPCTLTLQLLSGSVDKTVRVWDLRRSQTNSIATIPTSDPGTSFPSILAISPCAQPLRFLVLSLAADAEKLVTGSFMLKVFDFNLQTLRRKNLFSTFLLNLKQFFCLDADMFDVA